MSKREFFAELRKRGWSEHDFARKYGIAVRTVHEAQKIPRGWASFVSAKLPDQERTEAIVERAKEILRGQVS